MRVHYKRQTTKSGVKSSRPIFKYYLGSPLERAVEVIAAFPFAYPSSESYPDFRRCVVTPQTSLYYQIQPEEIEVVAVLDNRRDS